MNNFDTRFSFNYKTTGEDPEDSKFMNYMKKESDNVIKNIKGAYNNHRDFRIGVYSAAGVIALCCVYCICKSIYNCCCKKKKKNKNIDDDETGRNMNSSKAMSTWSMLGASETINVMINNGDDRTEINLTAEQER